MQQIHDEVQIPLSTSHRLLHALEAERFVARSDATRRFILGSAARDLISTSPSFNVPPALGSAAAEVGETAFLAQLRDRKVVCVAIVESRFNLRLTVKIGQEIPLHAAASARTILAYFEPALVERLVTESSMTPYTLGTIKDRNRLIDRLAEIRQRGFDVCDNELDENVWAVSAPVFSFDGAVHSSVTIAAAAARMQTAQRRINAAQAVARAARKLSEEAGFAGKSPAAAENDFIRSFFNRTAMTKNDIRTVSSSTSTGSRPAR